MIAALPFAAHAEYTGPGAVLAAPATVVTAAAAARLADHAAVTLEGNVVNKLSKDKYTFRDASGEIRVEIDHKYLPAENFDATSRVRLSGKVDKEISGVEVDVKSVQILR
ncbi:NirD/YgiW/YdeI family stress tolerance protein [Neisseriaceae bacterium B2N2-7]|uniref:NirD/YgiW/YdeI family stress tolerance protein n=2 Tax=Craterilacuibacter sinensis TaxID=2686017 RepID=A0A845BPY1_9NEIS|nr:NirD/YgiW/YdeI family stress tolerance protein [Craterilacuibacter sinensis]